METLYSHPEKRLEDHLRGVVDTGLQQFDRMTGLNLPYDSKDTRHLLTCLLVFHDAGKMTPYFQAYLLKKKDYELYRHKGLTDHGLVSALITAFQVYRFFSRHPEDLCLLYTSLAFAAVRKHHGNLENLSDMLLVNRNDWQKVEEQLPYCSPEFFTTHFAARVDTVPYSLGELKACHDKIDQAKWDILEDSSLELYLYFNFLYSLLLFSDKHDAILSAAGTVPTQRIQADVVDRYKRQAFKEKPTGLNQTKEAIYREVTESLRQLKPRDEQRIFSINCPTGTGKTLCSLNAALKLRESGQTRIIYCLPFTSIIDQNAGVFAEVLSVDFETVSSDLLLIHHHQVEPQWKDEHREYEGDKAEFLIETWNSELIVTTFWQFFHTLFTRKNNHLKKFHRLANSVIILDEIQAIPVQYWTLLNRALTRLVHLFNSKILLVTATMPMIFSEHKNEILELVPQKEIYFRNLRRVKLSIDSEHKTIPQLAQELGEKIDRHKRCLVILNTISSSLELYRCLAGFAPVYLSTNIIPKHRQKRIDKLKEKKSGQLVISTQLVEAGVDIDFDVVYRDNAPLDSLNQGAGRCNRENRAGQPGEVILVHLVNVNNRKLYSSYIYDRLLLHTTAALLQGEPVFWEDRFFDISREYFKRLSEIISRDSSLELLEHLTEMRYEDAFSGPHAFRLIDNSYERENIFVEIDEEAKEVWHAFVKIREIKDRWERKREFARIKNRFSRHLISVARETVKKNAPPFMEESGLYFIPYNQLKEYYHPQTGFITEGSTAIW